MKKRILALLVALFLVAGIVAPASASSVHLKPPNQNPSFTDLGIVLNAEGNLAGLGNGDVLVKLSATADVTATCTNPGDQSKVPGQNPAPITVTGSQSIPATEIKNGNTPFDVSTDAPQTPIPGAPDCPNPGWTEDITDLSFTSATLTVEQGGAVVFGPVTWTFTPPTVNGPVLDSDVTLVQ